MKKSLIFILSILSLLLVSCKSDEVDTNKETISETNESITETLTETKDLETKKNSIFAEGILKDKDYSNVLAEIDYLENENYELKIRIEQKDDIIFTTENQNVYADIYIYSKKNNTGEILHQKSIDDESLYKIPLVDNKIPAVTELVIDKDSKLLTEEEHNAILNKEPGLWISVQIRDPQGFILEISNTIFGEQKLD